MPRTDSSINLIIAGLAAKAAGFRNFKDFLESYGLSLDNHDDVEEGKAILRDMGYCVI